MVPTHHPQTCDATISFKKLTVTSTDHFDKRFMASKYIYLKHVNVSYFFIWTRTDYRLQTQKCKKVVKWFTRVVADDVSLAFSISVQQVYVEGKQMCFLFFSP